MKRFVWGAGIAALAASALIFLRWGDLRSSLIASEEDEIKTVLQVLYAAETKFFGDHGVYTGDTSPFEQVITKRATLVGLFPECSTGARVAFHVMGQHEPKFEERAQTVIRNEIIKGDCRDPRISFTAFAAQNLDEDDDFELWSIDQDGHLIQLMED